MKLINSLRNLLGLCINWGFHMYATEQPIWKNQYCRSTATTRKCKLCGLVQTDWGV